MRYSCLCLLILAVCCSGCSKRHTAARLGPDNQAHDAVRYLGRFENYPRQQAIHRRRPSSMGLFRALTDPRSFDPMGHHGHSVGLSQNADGAFIATLFDQQGREVAQQATSLDWVGGYLIGDVYSYLQFHLLHNAWIRQRFAFTLNANGDLVAHHYPGGLHFFTLVPLFDGFRRNRSRSIYRRLPTIAAGTNPNQAVPALRHQPPAQTPPPLLTTPNPAAPQPVYRSHSQP